MTEAPQEPQAPQTPAAMPPAGGAGQGNGLAIAGMVLGIVGLVGLCIWWLGLPCAIVGLILSICAKKKAAVTGTGGGMATAGIVTSVVALGLAVLGFIFMIVGFAIFSSAVKEGLENMPTQPSSFSVLRDLLPLH